MTLDEFANKHKLVLKSQVDFEPACHAPALAYAAVKNGWYRYQRKTGRPFELSETEFLQHVFGSDAR